MGVRLALLFANLGHQIILETRDRAARVIQQLGQTSLQPGNYYEAADAVFVLPAMFLRDGALDILNFFITVPAL